MVRASNAGACGGSRAMMCRKRELKHICDGMGTEYFFERAFHPLPTSTSPIRCACSSRQQNRTEHTHTHTQTHCPPHCPHSTCLPLISYCQRIYKPPPHSYPPHPPPSFSLSLPCPCLHLAFDTHSLQTPFASISFFF